MASCFEDRRHSFALLASAAVILFLSTTPQASAADSTPPSISNFQIGDCNGNLQPFGTLTTDTGTPTIQFNVKDSTSGLRIGNTPITGDGNASPSTVLFYDFNEAGGVGTVTDHSGQGNTGTVNGAVPLGGACGSGADPCRAASVVAGFGGLLSWSGATANASVSVPASLSLNSTTIQITIEAQINMADTTARPIAEFSNGTSTSGVQVWVNFGGRAGSVYANFIDTPTAGSFANSKTPVSHAVQTGANVLASGTTYLITATYDGAVAALYVNGVLQSSAATSITSGANLATLFTLYVGLDPLGPTPFNGTIDQLRVLNTALDSNAAEADNYSGKFKISVAGFGGPFTNTNLVSTNYTPAATDATTTFSTVTRTNVALASGSSNFVRFGIGDKTGNATSLQNNITVATHLPGTPSLSAVAVATGSIEWIWTQPSPICAGPSVNLYSCGSGAALFTGLPVSPPSVSSITEPTFGLNTLQGRRAAAVDNFGLGVLTACTSAYTQANPPGAFQSSNVSTGSMTLQWGSNLNPSYTRYELGKWTGTGFTFTTFVSSPITQSSNFTSTITAFGSLTPSTSYFWTLWTVNGSGSDSLGGQFTTTVSTVIPTLAAAPVTFTGTALGISSIAWSWSQVATAVAYRLTTSSGGALIDGSTNSLTLDGLQTNTVYSTTVTTRNQSGAGPASSVLSVATLADRPTGTAATGVSSNAVTLSWNPATNPAGTTYQVSGAQNSGFTSPLGALSVSTNSAVFTGLFPGTTYYFRVRALNANSIPTNFDSTVPAVTSMTAGVAISSAPPTPYVAATGTVGLWHFDEGIGTTTVDSSGNGNTGTPACTTPNCVSSPTFVTAGADPGLEGLGPKILFSGQQNSLVSVAHNAGLSFGASISVEAWVYPTTSLQTTGASIIAKGNGGDETFALDMSPSGNPGKVRFLVRDNTGLTLCTILSTQTVAANQWTHLAGVFDQPNFTLSIYVNGVLSNSAATGCISGRTNTHAISIGSRQSGSTTYDLPFTGAVDEVHLLNRVLLSTEAATDYASGLPGQLVPPLANSPITLIIPPNAFGGAANIYISTDAVNNPISVSRAALSSGLNAPPSGANGKAMTLVPGAVFEIVPVVDGAPFTGNLGSAATIMETYPDANGDGLIDGTNPPLAANNSNLTMYTFDPTVIRWIALTSSVDTANKRVVALTPHFSVFAMFGATGIQADSSQARVFPIPWKPGSNGKFDSTTVNGQTGLVFTNLPGDGSIRIFTLSGEEVVELPITAAAAGTVVWDGKNRGGRRVASGVYLAYIKSHAQAKTLKFAVER